LLILPTPPCLTTPLGNPLKFLDETYSAKTRGMGLLYGENCTILASTVFEILAALTPKIANFAYRDLETRSGFTQGHWFWYQ